MYYAMIQHMKPCTCETIDVTIYEAIYLWNYGYYNI